MTHDLSFIDHYRHLGLAMLAAAVAIVGVAACNPFRHGAASTQAPALLYFTNESLDQADVFAVVSNGQAVRIGTVMPGRTDTLVVPRDIAARGSNVNVVARLFARSAAAQSGPVSIHPGDELQIRLPVDQKLLVVLPASP